MNTEYTPASPSAASNAGCLRARTPFRWRAMLHHRLIARKGQPARCRGGSVRVSGRAACDISAARSGKDAGGTSAFADRAASTPGSQPRVAPFTFNAVILAVAFLILFSACRKQGTAPAEVWAAESRASAEGVDAVLRVSRTGLSAGATLDVALDLQAPAATLIDLPALTVPGLEALDFTVWPITLDKEGMERRRFRWKFQAGPVGTIAGRSLSLVYASGKLRRVLELKLPAIVVGSAFAPGQSANELPALEEGHAL